MRTQAPSQRPANGATVAPAMLGEEEFAHFFRESYPKLCGFLRTRTADTDCVDDIAQRAMMVARRRWERVRHLDQPGAWVTKVALRLLWREQTQRTQRSHRERTIQAALIARPAPNREPEHEELYAAIRRLPRRRAEVVGLHYLLGYSVAEVGDILGVLPSTVRSHLHLAREELKAILGTGDEDEVTR